MFFFFFFVSSNMNLLSSSVPRAFSFIASFHPLLFYLPVSAGSPLLNSSIRVDGLERGRVSACVGKREITSDRTGKGHFTSGVHRQNCCENDGQMEEVSVTHTDTLM